METEDFIHAAESGDIVKVQAGLNDGVDVNASIQYGQTALMKASMAGKLAVAKLLVENGANVNQVTQLNWTALCFAATRDHFEVVDFLIDTGANPNAICQDDCTILEWVIRQQSDRVSMFNHLLGRGAEIRPKTLVMARNNGEDGILKLIERQGRQLAGQTSRSENGQEKPAPVDLQEDKNKKPWWKLW